MSALSIGLSGITVSQRLLDITGQNIANAGTPGYHRQVVDLAPLDLSNPQGAGVTIIGVNRQRSDLIETALLGNTAESQDVTTQLDNLRQVQAFLAPGAGGIDAQLGSFFNEVKQLAARPEDLAQRSVVLNTAAGLAHTLNSAGDELSRLSASLDATGANIVNNVNNDARQIPDLNGQIQRATAAGQQPNELLDQRDQLISGLARLIDVRVIPTNFNEVNVVAAGTPVVAGTQSLPLQYVVGSNGQALIARAGPSPQALNVTGGQAAGLLQVRNGDLPQVRTQLDTLTQSLVQGVDEAQATGLALTGPLASVSGYRGLNDPTKPLSQTNLTFPPARGTLAISVTQTTGPSAGTRTLYQLNIDPTVQSLNQVAAAVSAAVPTLTASVNPSDNTLRIVAASGYAFDFAGRLPTGPQNVVGGIVPQVGGSYTGTTNDTYTYKVSGPGTVGVTPGLTLQVLNGANQVLDSFNIGQGYRAGAALPPVNGVTASVAAGALTGSESFQTTVTANPDTGNLLTALGVNTLFTGDSASTVAVRPDLLANPQLLSGSRNGDPGDGSNFTKIANLQNAQTLSNGTQTLGQYFAATVGNVGVRVQDLGNRQTAQQALGQQLSAQQQAVSGVDPNEELTKLLQFQRSFQMAARYIDVINQTLNTLLGILPLK